MRFTLYQSVSFCWNAFISWICLSFTSCFAHRLIDFLFVASRLHFKIIKTVKTILIWCFCCCCWCFAPNQIRNRWPWSDQNSIEIFLSYRKNYNLYFLIEMDLCTVVSGVILIECLSNWAIRLKFHCFTKRAKKSVASYALRYRLTEGRRKKNSKNFHILNVELALLSLRLTTVVDKNESQDQTSTTKKKRL